MENLEGKEKNDISPGYNMTKPRRRKSLICCQGLLVGCLEVGNYNLQKLSYVYSSFFAIAVVGFSL